MDFVAFSGSPNTNHNLDMVRYCKVRVEAEVVACSETPGPRSKVATCLFEQLQILSLMIYSLLGQIMGYHPKYVQKLGREGAQCVHCPFGGRM